MYLHKYLGVHDHTENGTRSDDVSIIQDLLYLENRDRKYDRNVCELRCIYDVANCEVDIMQFGSFISGDTIHIFLHMNDMVDIVGRRIMSGDVIELTHLRDDTLLAYDALAINKFYVVDDASKASEGFRQTWHPLVWRLKCRPMTASQEYRDILNIHGTNIFNVDTGKLADLMSTTKTDVDINARVIRSASASVSKRYFETRQFYVMPGDEIIGQNPWIFAGDGIPPNGAALLGSGSRFPEARVDGDYFLRTDTFPHGLYLFTSSAWRLQEQDYRQGDWSPASRILADFITNTKTSTHSDGTVIQDKQPLHRAIKPKADF